MPDRKFRPDRWIIDREAGSPRCGTSGIDRQIPDTIVTRRPGACPVHVGDEAARVLREFEISRPECIPAAYGPLDGARRDPALRCPPPVHLPAMSATNSNVISFPQARDGNDAGGTGETTLLDECRTLAVERLSEALAQGFDEVVDELYEQAERSFERDTRDFFLKAKDAWPAQRAAVEAAFRDAVAKRFAPIDRAPRETQAQFSLTTSSWTELSLVDDSELDEDVRFTEIAAKIRNSTDEELVALDQRMGVVLDQPELDSADNPLSPAGITGAFREALKAATIELEIKLLLIRHFDKHVRPATVSVIRDTNELLKQRGILPVIRYGSSKKPQVGTGPVEGPKPDASEPSIVGSVTLPIMSGGAPGAAGVMTLGSGMTLTAGGMPGGATFTPAAGAAGAPGVAGAMPAGAAGAASIGVSMGQPGAAADPFTMLQQLLLANIASGRLPAAPGAAGTPGFQGGAAPAAGSAAPAAPGTLPPLDALAAGGVGGGAVGGGGGPDWTPGVGGAGMPGSRGGAPGRFPGGGGVTGPAGESSGPAGGYDGSAGPGIGAGGGSGGGGPGARGYAGPAHGDFAPGMGGDGVPGAPGNEGFGPGGGGGYPGTGGGYPGAGGGYSGAGGGYPGAAPDAGGDMAGGPYAPGDVMATGSGGGPRATARLINSLTRIQQGDLGGVPDVPESVGEWLSTSGGNPEATLPTSAPNVLRALKSTALGRQMGQMDTVTLDIVSMLFDQIFGDDRIPPAMKALIGRLQIPMLKVAVLDKTFFSRKNHPARQMLDTLGELSLGLGDGFDRSSDLYQRIESALTQLVEEFQEDVGVFDRITGEFDSIITELNRAADAAGKVEEDRIRDRERLEVARLFAQNELKNRIENQNLPKLVLRFLLTEWMKLLILAYAKSGREGRSWASLLETMDILVWSLTPKITVEERRRLVSLLPGLLKRLSKGMEVAGTDPQLRERFNAVLMRCHARTIAGADASSAPPPRPKPAPKATPTPERQPTLPQTPPPAASTTPAVPPSELAIEPPPSPEALQVPPPDITIPGGMIIEEVSFDGVPTGNPDITLSPAGLPPAPPAPSPEPPPAEPLPFVEEMSLEAPPANFPTVKVRNPFGEGDIEVEEVNFGDLPGFAPSGSAPGATLDPAVQTVNAMKEGDWVEIRQDGRDPIQARLSLVSPYRGTFVFSNRKGQKVAEYSLYQVTSYIRSGQLTPIEASPLFDRAFGNLVSLLRGGAHADH